MPPHPRQYTRTAHWQGALRRRLFERDGGCVFCGDQGSDGRGKGLHVAHLVADPLGPPDESNTFMACASDHRKYDAARKREQAW